MSFFSAAVTFCIEKFAILTNVRSSASFAGRMCVLIRFHVVPCCTLRCRDLLIDEDLTGKIFNFLHIRGCDSCLSKLVGSALDGAVFFTSSAVLRVDSNVCASFIRFCECDRFLRNYLVTHIARLETMQHLFNKHFI